MLKEEYVVVGIANIFFALFLPFALVNDLINGWLAFILTAFFISADIYFLKIYYISQKMKKDKVFEEKIFKKLEEKQKKRDEEWRKQNYSLRLQKLDEYKKEEKKQKKLAQKFGQEKYTYFLNEQQDAIMSIRKMGMIMESSVYQERKNDWAIIGGFAEGIAGPAAGVAAAMNAIQDNDRIERENEERRIWGKQMNDQMRSLASNATEMYIESCTRRYIADFSIPTSKLFASLTFETEKIEIDRLTEAVHVRVHWMCSNTFSSIDGAFCGILYNDNGERVGEVYFSLPMEGTIINKSGYIRGVCAEPIKPGPYTVKYEPINLWKCSIEKGY